MLSNVLFDLDGTLTDSQEGVIKCFQYAIKELGQLYYNESEIMNLIGVPIRSIFQKLLDSKDNDLINKAISLYRERFTEVGIFENKVYPGIPELLAALFKNSYRLDIVTLKPKEDAERIAKHFSFDKWIQSIYGPNLRGYPESKIQLIESAITDSILIPNETAIVGDRKEDIIAGKTNGIITIGVTYGYGSKEEIVAADPDYICDSPHKVQQSILNH
ncbi:HAD hydrolase-like protein [Chloroflexota bacterium]